jgi:fatty acid-binding protein DegV
VAHSSAQEEAQALADELRPLCTCMPLVIDVTTVIGAHIGPGALGVIGMRA